VAWAECPAWATTKVPTNTSDFSFFGFCIIPSLFRAARSGNRSWILHIGNCFEDRVFAHRNRGCHKRAGAKYLSETKKSGVLACFDDFYRARFFRYHQPRFPESVAGNSHKTVLPVP
jgi:hypothetical protein